MKTILIFASLSLFSSFALARECQVNDKGEVDWKTECRLDGSSYLIKQCKEIKVPGSTPGTYKYEYVPKKFGWGRVSSVDKECDINIHECKELAEKMLAEYSWTDECGQVAKMKKVKFQYSVLDELDLKFKIIHKGKVKK